MVEKFDISRGTGTYEKIQHNDEFSKLIGYYGYLPRILDAYNGFHIFSYVYTKNWLNYYVKLYKVWLENIQGLVWESDEIKVRDINGDDISGYFEYFRQIYIENYEFVEEHYTVFHKTGN